MSTQSIDYILLDYPTEKGSGLKVDYVALWEPGEYTASVRVWQAIPFELPNGMKDIFAFEPWPKGPVPVLEAKNPELLAIFEGDGCADITLSPSGGMYHVCGMDGIQTLHKLLVWLHTRAPTFIKLI